MTDEERQAQEAAAAAAAQTERDRTAQEDADASDGDDEHDEQDDGLTEEQRSRVRAARKAERDAKAALRAANKRAEEAEAALKARQDAELSDLERAQAEAKEANDRATAAEQRQRDTVLRLAVTVEANKLNLHDPEVAHRLLDLGEVEYDDAGAPTNVEALMKALAKAHPYLVKGKASSDVEPSPDGHDKPPSDEELRKQAGNRLHRARL